MTDAQIQRQRRPQASRARARAPDTRNPSHEATPGGREITRWPPANTVARNTPTERIAVPAHDLGRLRRLPKLAADNAGGRRWHQTTVRTALLAGRFTDEANQPQPLLRCELRSPRVRGATRLAARMGRPSLARGDVEL